MVPALPSSGTPVTLGLLLVHGIGEQKRGDTLVTWLDALLETIGDATHPRVSTNVEWADLKAPSPHEASRPACAIARINDKERWLVAEGWWAETFAAPSFSQLVSWSVRAVPSSIAMHVIQNHEERLREAQTRLGRARAWIYTVAALTTLLFLAPLLVAILASLLLVGLLPFETTRRMVGSIQRALSATVGDSMVLLESSVRAAAIRVEVLDALHWLRATCHAHGCDRIVVLAHSQGAAIAVDALAAPEPPAIVENRVLSSSQPLSMLLTFGAGINTRARLRSLRARSRPSESGSKGTTDSLLEADPTLAASLLLFGTAIVGVWFWRLVSTGRLSLLQLLAVPLAWLVASLLLGGLAAAARRSVRAFGETTRWVEKVATGILSVGFLGLVGTAYWYAETTRTPLAPFFALFFVMLSLMVSLRSLLAGPFNRRLMAATVVPPDIAHWEDFWASADPVPNGPVRTRGTDAPASHKIWNEASLLHDHVSYWGNRAGFALPIVRALARTAKSSWQGRLPPSWIDPSARDRWRTGWLRGARCLIPAACLLVGLLKASQLEAFRSALALRIESAVGLPRWIDDLSLPWTWLFRWGLVIFASWLAYVIVRSVWRAWTRWEHQLILMHREPSGLPVGFYAFGVVQSLVIGFAFAIAVADWQAVSNTVTSGKWEVGDALFNLWIALCSATFIVWAVSRVFPPPSPKDPGPQAPGESVPDMSSTRGER